LFRFRYRHDIIETGTSKKAGPTEGLKSGFNQGITGCKPRAPAFTPGSPKRPSRPSAPAVSGYRFVDIEILNNEQGKPELVLQGKVKSFCEENGITGFHVSLSHIKELAKAVVVLERH
jgi:hypothetical protein